MIHRLKTYFILNLKHAGACIYSCETPSLYSMGTTSLDGLYIRNDINNEIKIKTKNINVNT